MNRCSRTFQVRTFVVLLGLLALTSSLAAQANLKGQWSTITNGSGTAIPMPINPVHVAMLHTGKVLVVSGSGNVPTNTNWQAGIWDPQTGLTTMQPLSWDMFCNGMVILPDGRVFVNGGTLQYDPFHGELRSAIYDPASNVFTTVQNMAHGRWYPTATSLGDGRVMTFSGLNDTTGATNQTVEIYTVGSGWSAEFAAPFTPPLYPRMHLLPNGKVFYSGPGTSSALFDPIAHTWATGVATTNYTGTRTYGTSVLLPLTPANAYDPKILIMGGGNPATPTAEVIDMGATTPHWQFTQNSMTAGRIEMNAVMLPNGKVLAMGGSSSDEDESTATLVADLYDPATNSFTAMAPNVTPRVYHSVALLLSDATVWLAGGNPVRGTYRTPMEIYKPPYLFANDGSAAVRPTISSAPSAASYGSGFTVQTPDAGDISSVVLVKAGSPTHAFDMDQRLVALTFTAGFNSLTVTAPPTGNIAPPGYYMLFLLNSDGVPSLATFVRLFPNPAPTVASVSPSSGTGAGGTSVTITGTGFLTGALITVGGASASGVNVASSTSITATVPAHSAGAVAVVVTNTDGQSATLANGFTYTSNNPAPTVSGISPTSGGTTGGAAVAITGTGFLSGASVTFGGSAATAVNVINGTSLTAITPAHAAGAVSVVVSNTDGKSATLTNGYTYLVTAAVGFSQVASADPQTPVSTVAVAFPGAQTAGNLNVIAVGWNDITSSVTNVTDSQGNPYSLAIGPTRGAGLSQSIYYARNIRSGANTVTVTFNTAAAFVDVRILEYSGLDPASPLDVTAGAAGSGTALSSGAATTNSPSELIFGANMVATLTSAAGTNFTSRIVTSPDSDLAEDRIVSTGGSYSATSTQGSSGSWIMQMATFRAAGQVANPAPTLSSVSPVSGTSNGGTVVTLAGTGFLSGATVSFGGTAATGVNVVSGTSITATTPLHAVGAVSVVVTNTDTKNATLANGFTYVNPPPAISTISPGGGTTAGGTSVTITGSGFRTGATVNFGTTAATGVTVVSGTSITATTPAHALGVVNVVVTNTDAQSATLSGGFSYNAAPTITSITPTSGPAGTAVGIAGNGFLPGASVSFGGTAAIGVTVTSGTSITALAPAHAAGLVSVTVINSDGQSSTGTSFTYTSSTPAPTVSAISPLSGTTLGGTAITVTGTGFLTGATVTVGGSPATGVNILSATSITAIAPAHAAGATNVVVRNSDGQTGTLANGYTYIAPTPAVTTVSPNTGTTSGGTTVTITGTGFVAGAAVTFGGTAATGVNVVNSTSITATTPAHAAGAVNVVVTNSGGPSGTLNNGYTYVVSAAIGFAQVASATPQNSVTTLAVPYPGAQVAGHLNVVVVGWNDATSTITNVTDTQGNAYTLAIGPTRGTALSQSIYYARNIKSGANTVTVTFNTAAAFVDMRIMEYSGLSTTAPLDVTAGASGNSATPSSGAATTTSPSELIIGANTIWTLNSAAGSGFTVRIITSPDSDLVEDRTVTATGSYSAGSTLSSSGPWVMQMVTFK